MPEVAYSAGLDSPVLLEQGRATTITCPLRRSGALVAPASGTVSIFDASGTEVVTAAVVAITDDVATYDTPTFASSDLGLGWRVVWVLLVDSVARTFRATAGLVRTVPYPTVSDATITTRVPALDSTGAGAITRTTTFQSQIEDSWKEIRRRLNRSGPRIHLVVDQSDLEEPHLLLTLANIFEGLGAVKPEWLDTAKRYREEYEQAWGQVTLTYDTDDDGDVDDDRRSAGGSLWLCGR